MACDADYALAVMPAPKTEESNMPATFTWNDVDDVADALFASYPETDPLGITFPRLQQMIIGLDGFDDQPDRTTEARLEQIQMAWYDLSYGGE